MVKAIGRATIELSWPAYFIINASAVVLIENAAVRAVALVLLALGTAALLRRGSTLAEVAGAPAFASTFLLVGSTLYAVALPHDAPTTAPKRQLKGNRPQRFSAFGRSFLWAVQ